MNLLAVRIARSLKSSGPASIAHTHLEIGRSNRASENRFVAVTSESWISSAFRRRTNLRAKYGA